MRKNRSARKLILTTGISLVLLQGCVEPLDFESRDFEDQLVISGVISGENETQSIEIDRTIPLDGDGDRFVSEASVRVISDAGESFDFTHTEGGRYLSNRPFAATFGNQYTLMVNYADQEFRSTPMEMLATPEIDSLFLEIEEGNQLFGTAINIKLTSAEDLTGETDYLIWDWREDYQVQVSHPENLVYAGGANFVSNLDPNLVCFLNRTTDKILIEDLTPLSTRKVEGISVVTFATGGLETRRNYGIQVRQRRISQEEYEYWLRVQSNSQMEGGLISEQPGRITGNITNVTNPSRSVLGFFSVGDLKVRSRVFNQFELGSMRFPPSQIFVDDCTDMDVIVVAAGDEERFFSEWDPSQFVIWARPGRDFPAPGGAVLVVPRECGDCTVWGPREAPDYWE